MRLDEAVITVVPEHDETEIRHRCEHRCPRTHHDPNTSASNIEERAIPGTWTYVSAQHAVRTWAQRSR
jgi:hypothetical protein